MSPSPSVAGRAYDAWTRFWHTPADPRLAASLRIGFGLLVLVWFVSQVGWVETWWGDGGMVPRRVGRAILERGEGSLLFLLPRGAVWLWLCWGAAVLQAALLVVGWRAHVQAACVYGWLVAFQNRNIAILDGEDGLFRLIAFFLIFVPMSEVWSLDARRRARAGKGPRDRSGWALRMIQLQVCLVFFVAGVEKWRGAMWLDGTAMHYVMALDDLYGRLPVPQAIERSLLASQLMSWGTLVLEILLPLTVWHPRTRRISMLVAVAFHLALEWMMNLFLFEWLMILCWLAFVRWDEDVAWARGWLARLGPARRDPPAVTDRAA